MVMLCLHKEFGFGEGAVDVSSNQWCSGYGGGTINSDGVLCMYRMREEWR